ncbi:HPr family phosphocarrier protein [Halanaerobacter jeridensis]|uniref:Phosphocarrier protein HPr n=1 Tax=Halanaerobacter jeridensis TaxID=706427 RepID=A0A939BQ09_9FIRM|nr:phosphotransferase system HPr (HPr) family protein [Halanaerobacter jeridensis]
MKKKEVIISNEVGLHARPASLLINNAVQFDSEMKMIYENQEANLKSIISLMSLAVGPGEEVTIKAEGADEEEALSKIIDIIENGFNA